VNRSGLLATGITPGGPLGNAGILPGAVITAVGKYAPTNLAELENALGNYDAGETITVKVLVASGLMPTPFQPGQWGQEQNITVKLGRRPAPVSPEDS
jgi:S1-C subfamily serine protease